MKATAKTALSELLTAYQRGKKHYTLVLAAAIKNKICKEKYFKSIKVGAIKP